MGHAENERRREPRHPARFDVRFQQAAHAARALSTFSVNFSTGGLCLKTQTTYELGEVLDLNMTIEGELFELRGEVAWARHGAIGVRFVDLSIRDKGRLEAVVAVLEKRPDGR